MPVNPHFTGPIGHSDHVLTDGRPIGIASAVVYSYYFHKILSHCTIDIEQAAIGNEVIVQWGDHGKRIKEVHARVALYPYLTENRNQVVNTIGVSERRV